MSEGADVIVATTTFGMGVDKLNVRFVYHLEVSESVDAYYQEIGRAGRDGEPAEAILFDRPEDLNLRRFLTGSGQVDAEQMTRVAEAVQDATEPLQVAEIGEETDLSQTKVMIALNRLEEVGAVDMMPSGTVVATENGAVADAAAEAAEAQENLRKFARSRIEMMRGYADMIDCRREYILNYFGEVYAPHVITATTVCRVWQMQSRRQPSRSRSMARLCTKSGVRGWSCATRATPWSSSSTRSVIAPWP